VQQNRGAHKIKVPIKREGRGEGAVPRGTWQVVASKANRTAQEGQVAAELGMGDQPAQESVVE
jgi:hypothetical protein